MADIISMKGWAIVLSQAGLFLLLSPLLVGWIKWVKCHLQNRQAPSLVQPYLDLIKLFSKQVLLPKKASLIFRMAPYIIAGMMVLVAASVPLIIIRVPFAASADMIVLVGFFAMARFFQSLAGMDIGTAFGGMGASREMTLSALAEPAMLIAVFTLSMVAHSSNLSSVIETLLDQGIVLRPSLLFTFFGILLVAIAETGRIPVDNPATHLELTMIHEAMILEYSGRMLGLIEWASMTKLMIYGVLLANIFFPWGISADLEPVNLLSALGWVALKLFILATALAFAETLLAKMRLFKVPVFLSLAFTFSILGLLSHIILEAGA